ncbi:YciI family protein [Kitasatospora griseola]|uniref:YciI family protein n=1 Tax=Kitasatospora griseola TaxID=2064 RepID=UPI00382324CB
MKFLIGLRIDLAILDALADEEKTGLGGGHGRFVQAPKDSGELILPQALVDPSQSAVVSVRAGQPVVTDGPFPEAAELLGGFQLVDRENRERAIEPAAPIPGAAIPGLGGGGASGDVLRRALGRMTAPGCEDAVQEAVPAAAVQWSAEVVPDSPPRPRPCRTVRAAGR